MSATSRRTTETSRGKSTPKRRPGRTAHPTEFEEQWDRTQYRYCPHRLKGIKPMTIELWKDDAKGYWQMNKEKQRQRILDKYDLFTKYDTFTTKGGYTSVHTTTEGRPQWDSSSYRHIPAGLRGLQPRTREPWCDDPEIVNLNSLRDVTDSFHDDMDSFHNKDAEPASQGGLVDRESFYMSKYERWATRQVR